MMILFWAAKGWNAPVAILYPDKFKMKVENLREKSQLLGFLKKKKFCCIPNIFSVLWRTKVQWFNIKIPSEGPWYGPTCVTPGVTASASESISTNQRQLASISTNQHQSASINFNQYQSASIIINKNQSTSIRKNWIDGCDGTTNLSFYLLEFSVLVHNVPFGTSQPLGLEKAPFCRQRLTGHQNLKC